METLEFLSEDDNINTYDVVKHIESNFPFISIKAVAEPTEEMKSKYEIRQAEFHKKPHMFNEFSYLTANQIQSRLSNVSVTLLSNEIQIEPSPHNDNQLTDHVEYFLRTYEGVKFATPDWFYLQYISCIKDPTAETCMLARTAACAAATAYQNAFHYPDTISLVQRVYNVALQAHFLILCSAFQNSNESLVTKSPQNNKFKL